MEVLTGGRMVNAHYLTIERRLNNIGHPKAGSIVCQEEREDVCR